MTHSFSLRLFAALAFASGFFVVAIPAQAAPSAQVWIEQGDALVRAGRPADAVDLYEAGLVLNPKSAPAYIGLGRAYDAQKMPGKALRYYRQALIVEPNNLIALEAQAMGFLAKGASERARANLAKVRQLCKSECGSATRISQAIAASSTRPVAARPTPTRTVKAQ